MGSGGGWLIDYMDDEVVAVEASDFIWSPPSPPHLLSHQSLSSDDPCLNVSRKEDSLKENSCLKKRRRVETCTAPGLKACREKIRRDKLNDRFLELCSILDMGRPPKTDKIIILRDATRLLNQLRLEAQKLKESNEALKDSIKSLKAEKSELREEKVKLKIEKERMEEAVKGVSMASPFVPHPAFHPSAAAFAANGKNVPYNLNCPPKLAMWQWMAPAFVDTSQDHVLRPPVA